MAPQKARTTTGASFLFLAMLLVNIGNHGCQATHTETSVLLSWLTQIQDPHGSLRNWVSSSVSPCDWTGILCSGDQVIQINLSNMGLSGTLNPGLGQLEFLATFNISTNYFSGAIPPEICSWSNLQTLALDRNSFAGSSPSCLSQLKQLLVMDLSYNLLTYLQDGIGLFLQLSVLNVEGCALNGTIPPAIGNITTLTSLSLGGNQLTGPIPPELSQLQRLQRLHLGYNSLVGEIPWQLGLMGSLKYLNLAENNLTGKVPGILWNLLQLQEAELFGNYLNGALPANMGNAASLISLDISDNFLSGRIPEDIGNVFSLEFLNLSKNELVGQIPPTLSTLPTLRVLSLSLNNLTGSIPQGFGVHSNITTLDLSSNQFVKLIPTGLCHSGGLAILDLSYNDLNDSIPKDLQSCESLMRLTLAHNSLSGSLPDAIGTIPMLSYLDISANRLNGTLDNALFGSESASLTELYLQDNQFIGSLPESMGDMENLSKLDVSRNNFSGEIPQQLGNCTKLSQLILEGNNFSGSIPQEISNSKDLQVINLSWNALDGQIPALFGSLLAMEDLDLSHNKFNGSIPEELANCSSLVSLDLSYNNFSGPVPVEGLFQRIINISLAGNPFLCGGPPRFQLQSCPEDEQLPTSTKILTVILVVFSVLGFAIAFWWEGRNLGDFHDMEEIAVGQACSSNDQVNIVAGGRAVEEREMSMWEPELEPAGNLEAEEELTVFRSGQVEQVLDEEQETVLLPQESVNTSLKPWKLVILAPELDLTDDEVHQTCVPDKLACGGDSAVMYFGTTKNGLDFVVEKHLSPEKGENLSNVLRRLGQFRHPHIVKLLGYCLDINDNSLVAVLFESMRGGSLRDALDGGKLSRRPHKLGARVDIALGIVRGLHYLHNMQPIYGPPLHERIKSKYVHLDRNMKAYLLMRVDLTELDPPRKSTSERSSTSAAEQMKSSSCRDGVDIYDIGVVLLELLSGRPVVSPDGMHIVNWYNESMQTEAMVPDLLDRTLGNHMLAQTKHEVKALFSLAAKCIDVRPESRPTLDEMQKYLLGLSRATLDKPPKPRGPSGSSHSEIRAL